MDITKLDPNLLALLGTLVSAVGDLVQGVASEVAFLQAREQEEKQARQDKEQEEKLAGLQAEVRALKDELAAIRKALDE